MAEVDRESFDEGYSAGYHNGFDDGYAKGKSENYVAEPWVGRAKSND